MKKFISDSLIALRLALAMTLVMTGVEVGGYYLLHVNFNLLFFPEAVLIALIGSIAGSLVLGLLNLVLRLGHTDFERLVCLFMGLVLIYLVLVLRLWTVGFEEKRSWYALAAFLLLLPVLAAGGLVGWRFLGRGGADQATARFQAFAPVVAIGAGIWSVLAQKLEGSRALPAAEVALLVVAVAALYLVARLMWGRRRKALHRRGVWLHGVVIVVVLAAALIVAGREYQRRHRPTGAPAGSPSVILISIDTLRADHLSCYNPKAAPTPVIDSLARDGIRFEHAISGSNWTEPSVATFLAGMPASAAGAAILTAGRPYNYTGIMPGVLTVAEAFQDRGYTTMAEIHNPWISPWRYFDQGFDHFRSVSMRRFLPRLLIARAYEMVQKAIRRPLTESPYLNRNALETLRAKPPGPFMLWIHYLDPHLPYYAHPEFPTHTKPGIMSEYLCDLTTPAFFRDGLTGLSERDHDFARERYEGEVRYNDQTLGVLIKWLKRHKLYDSSLIVLTSDHGEELWDHGGFEHGHTFYQELIHVPLIIKLPGNREAGRVISPYLGMSRLAATMTDAAGVKSAVKGTSLLKCLTDPQCGDTTIGGRFWISERPLYGNDPGALGDLSGHKVIFKADGSMICFDLNQDPQEQHPIAEAQCPWDPEEPPPRQLWKTIQARDLETYHSLGGGKTREVGSSQENNDGLRDLGYIQ